VQRALDRPVEREAVIASIARRLLDRERGHGTTQKSDTPQPQNSTPARERAGPVRE